MKNQTLLLFAENKPGVLNKIFGLIRKKMYNVESITAYPTETKGISRITINFSGSEKTDITQIMRQIEKVVEVTKVINVTDSPAVKRELALIKVKAKNGHRAEVSQLAEIFRGSIVDVSSETMIVQIVGNTQKVDSAVELLQDFGVTEIARTGVTAIERD
ncbi:acetolactate synthase small subunit [Candidatus Dojkabacteria bacterium]|nr:acetolactate synthase small subunit [Candidatus Dojkabacteria bacterium]